MTLDEILLNFKYAFRPQKPKLFFRLAKAFVNAVVFKRPQLRYVDFAINFECNQKCDHCFAVSLVDKKRKTMAHEDYENVAKQCMRLGAVNFSFQGGEPLLSKELKNIISACKPEKNLISVTTNGTLLTENKIDELKAMGVDILTVSLDSSIPQQHDNFRKLEGSFEKAIAGIKLVLKKGLNVTLGTVVTHKTLKSDGINGLLKLAMELKVLLYIILPVKAGRWVDSSDLELTRDDIDYIDSLTKSSPYIRTDFQANLGGYGCGAAKEILYLTPYGDVLVCPFIHIAFGNIFNEPVEAIRNRAVSNPYLSKYHNKCLASTDKEFIEKYLSKTFNVKNLPLNSKEVFMENIE